MNSRIIFRFYILALLFLMMATTSSFGFRVTRYSANKGFTRNSVSTITQSKEGYLWIGTPNGLFRYDGYKFLKFQHEFRNKNSLLDNTIHYSYADRQGEIWIVSSKGLSIYNETEKKFRNIEGWPYSAITSITEIDDNKFIIGTNDGLFSAEKGNIKDSLEITEIPLLNTMIKSPQRVYDMIINSKNKLLISINKTIISWDIKALQKSVPYIPEPTILNEDLGFRVSKIEEIKDKGYLLGSAEGLFRSKDFTTITKVSLKKEDSKTRIYIKDIIEDHTGTIWVATEKEGLFEYNKRYNSWIQHKQIVRNNTALGSNNIRKLFEDRFGVLWIGTVRGGLNSSNTEQAPFIHIRRQSITNKSLKSNVIDGLFEDTTGKLWVGTFNRGLNVVEFNGADYSVFNVNLPQEVSRVYTITQDKDGSIYCGSNLPGLIKFNWNNNTRKIENYQHIVLKDSLNHNLSQISKIIIDKSGIFWLGSSLTNIGLVRYDPKIGPNGITHYTGQSPQNHYTINNIVDICEDKFNNLWIGTYKQGVFHVRINRKTRLPYRFISYTHHFNRENTIANNQVFTVMEGCDTNIWLGLFGEGINRIITPRKGCKLKISHFSTSDGLPDDVVYGIVESPKGQLWMSTNYGISNLNLETMRFTNYDKEDGLQDNNFRKYSFCKGQSGKIYFGGINGVTAFNPKKIRKNNFKPKVLITGMKVFNETLDRNHKNKELPKINTSIDKLKSVTLTHDQNTFSLHFVGLHYISPNKNIYRYKLEGFNTEWIYPENSIRQASFANMNPGKYVFKVSASNSDGIWSDETATLRINVLPPWWQTWWAYILYGILFIAGLMIFKKVILIKHEYQNKLSIERLEKEKIQELNKEKLEFFTNVSHEFKTPLTLITGPVSDIIDSKEQLSSHTKEDLHLIQSNADRLLRLINQLIDFRRIETGHLKLDISFDDYVVFSRNIVLSFQKVAQKKGIKLEYKSINEQQKINFDKEKLETILYNIISNAIKHTDKGGSVTIYANATNKGQKPDPEGIYWNVDHSLKEYIEFVVTNTGAEIQQEQLPLLFNRFYSRDENNEQEQIFSSSGIGLTLTHGMVELYKGKLGVVSEDGKVTFIVRIPFNKAEKPIQFKETKTIVIHEITEEVNYEESTKEVQAEYHEDVTSNKPLILVVDDHREIREFIAQILSNKYEIIEAENGKVALEKVTKVIPDLIISDVMMPEMNGLELCRLVKTNDITNHIPIILLTAKTEIEHRIEGIDMGADSYIPKPFNIKHLVIRVEKLLELRNSLREKFKNNFLLIDKSPSGMSESDLKFVKQAEQMILENIMEEDFSVEKLGRELAYSRMQLYRKMKSITGLSPNEFIRNYRLKQAAANLQKGEQSITEVLYQVGFSNKSYFTKCFKEFYGETPKEYSKRYNK
ncbi:response regulator [Halosquirtibacter laminarini]|uniref:Response regulator n=1 Tax=Halosquirtibacter laminarini TaxID=3374600 RepID=A0AC61NG21_9BACT|nr:response regulator [Prolixibacteraceae bacterium]